MQCDMIGALGVDIGAPVLEPTYLPRYLPHNNAHTPPDGNLWGAGVKELHTFSYHNQHALPKPSHGTEHVVKRDIFVGDTDR